jgi:hypothetical protein
MPIAATVLVLLVSCAASKGWDRQETARDEACGSGKIFLGEAATGFCADAVSLGERCGGSKHCERRLECHRDRCVLHGTAEREAEQAAKSACVWNPDPRECATREAPERVRKYAAHVRFERVTDVASLRSIARGVFIIWHDHIFEDSDSLLHVLVDAPPSFEIVVALGDCASRDLMMLPELGCPLPQYPGNDVAWVRNGRIVATASRRDTTQFRTKTLALAALP